MTDPGLAQTDPLTGGRHYTSRSRWLVEDGRIVNSGELPDNREFPSVTQILGMLDKSGSLVPAAVKLTAENAVDTAPEWMGDLADDWDNGRDVVVGKLKSHYREVWYRKARRGSEIHELVDQVWVRGNRLEDVYERIAGDPMWSGFRAEETDEVLRPLTLFFDKYVAEVLATEGTCYATQEGWAGSFDCLVRLRDGRVAVLDWKTGKGPYSNFALQLQAYAMADRLAVPVEYVGEPGNRKPSRWRLERMPRPEVGGIVMLRGGYKADVTWVEFSDMKAEVVRGLRAAYMWNRFEGNAYVSEKTGRVCGAEQMWYRDRDEFEAEGQDVPVSSLTGDDGGGREIPSRVRPDNDDW